MILLELACQGNASKNTLVEKLFLIKKNPRLEISHSLAHVAWGNLRALHRGSSGATQLFMQKSAFDQN